MPQSTACRQARRSGGGWLAFSWLLLAALLVACGADQVEPVLPDYGPPVDRIPFELRAQAAEGRQQLVQNEAGKPEAPAVGPHQEPGAPDPATAMDAPPVAEAPSTKEPAEPAEVEDTDPSALSDFDEHLQPYGEWIEDPDYGTVWVPYPAVVGTKFAPYVTRGHWALTPDNQWIWVSDYPFGWVTFHYGRWVWGPSYGWMWIPGRLYSHAWVTFRVSNDPYIGWAPMPPRYVWRAGMAVWIGHVPMAPYVYVPIGYAFYPSVYSYVIYQPARVRWIAGRSRHYRPRGAPSGRYYCPPIERVPARARPSGRVTPDDRSLALQRYRLTSPGAAGIDARRPSASDRRSGVGGRSRTIGTSRNPSSRQFQTSQPGQRAQGSAARERRTNADGSRNTRVYRAGDGRPRETDQTPRRRDVELRQEERRTTTTRGAKEKPNTAPVRVHPERLRKVPTGDGDRRKPVKRSKKETNTKRAETDEQPGKARTETPAKRPSRSRARLPAPRRLSPRRPSAPRRAPSPRRRW